MGSTQKNQSTWKVGKLHSGKTLLAFLKEHLPPHFSAKQLKKAIDSNCCQVNGRTERFSSSLVGTGDEIVFETNPESFIKPKSISEQKIPILYQDRFILAIDKPAGFTADDLTMAKYLEGQFGRIFLAHRLDKETTGVLLFARNEKVRDLLFQKFKDHAITKEYVCIVDGIPGQKSGVIENYLVKNAAYQGQAIWGVSKDKQGLYAKTGWTVEGVGKKTALVRCFPVTGRTHQIRVHMASLGHPILGDHQYARTVSGLYRAPRVLLHAIKSSFIHPAEKGELSIEAPLPQDIREAIHSLAILPG